MAELRLRYELVPRPLWGLSVYRALKGARWDRLRREVLEDAGRRCQPCGDTRERGMVCHEVWEYDDPDAVATLRCFRIICPNCNFATHRGMAGNIAKTDLAEIADAHMARVNGLTVEEVHGLYRDALVIWGQRSERQWTVVIDPPLLARYPVLQGLDLAHQAKS